VSSDEFEMVLPTSACLSDLALDQLITGETAGTRAAPQRAHIDHCGACRRRLKALEQVAVELFRAHPTLGLSPASSEATRERGRSVRSRARAALAAASAAALALALFVAFERTEPSLRKKGSVLTLDVFIRRADGRVEPLLPKGSAFPGDALRFQISNGASEAHVAVLSVDGAGAITLYAPNAPELVPLAAHERRLLEGSVVLDDQLGRERLLAFSCARRVSSEQLLGAARAIGGAELQRSPEPIAIGLPCLERSFFFYKVRPE